MSENIKICDASIINHYEPPHNDPAMDTNNTQTTSSLNIHNTTNMNDFSMAGACGGQRNLGRNDSGRDLSGRVDGCENYTFSPPYKEKDEKNTNNTLTNFLNIQNLSEFNFSMAGACGGELQLGRDGRILSGLSG